MCSSCLIRESRIMAFLMRFICDVFLMRYGFGWVTGQNTIPETAIVKQLSAKQEDVQHFIFDIGNLVFSPAFF